MRRNQAACHWRAFLVEMNPVSPALARPLAAAAALAVAAPLRAVEVTTPLPAVSDPIGFAGGFAGVQGTHLIAGGGANFPDGVMPWDGGKKVWHDRLFLLDLADPATGWKAAGTLPRPNGYGVSITTPEGILVIGGSDATKHFAETRLITLQDGTAKFRELEPLPKPLAQMAGALVGRKVHLCGGIETPADTRASGAHWMLDLDDLSMGWQNLPPLPAEGRILASAATIEDRFIVAGGCSLAPDATGKATRSYLREAWSFSHNTWKRLADMPRASVAAASPAPVRGGAMFIVSGDDGTHTGSPATHKGFTKEILRYEAGTNRWSTIGELDLPAPVTLPTAPWKDGYVFFNGEVKPGVRTPQVFLFTPPEIP